MWPEGVGSRREWTWGRPRGVDSVLVGRRAWAETRYSNRMYYFVTGNEAMKIVNVTTCRGWGFKVWGSRDVIAGLLIRAGILLRLERMGFDGAGLHLDRPTGVSLRLRSLQALQLQLADSARNQQTWPSVAGVDHENTPR